jgi:cytochrome c-type biogenesis protein CcmH
MTFWIITSAMALVVAATLALVLLRSRASAGPAAAFDLQVYRDQLKDVDRDLERGVIGEADAERIRTEVSRRILTADAAMRAAGARGGQSRSLSRVAAGLLGAGLIGGSLMLYRSLGAPGYGDLGLKQRMASAEAMAASRPGQEEAEAMLAEQAPPAEVNPDYLALVEKLRVTVTERPNDLRGQMLLARSEATLGNFEAARMAQAEVLRLKGAEATVADYVEQADLMIMAAGGYVSPEAEVVLNTILEMDPRNGPARYYTGLMQAQTGRPDLAFRAWNRLLQEGRPDAPWVAPIRAQIGDLAGLAGVEYALPALPSAPAAPGPTEADLQAAGEMSAQDRQEMIRGMVQGLSDRLATEGGTPPEWARLIGALGVLGETARAEAILAEAREVFAGNDEALSVIADAARTAGIAP